MEPRDQIKGVQNAIQGRVCELNRIDGFSDQSLVDFHSQDEQTKTREVNSQSDRAPNLLYEA